MNNKQKDIQLFIIVILFLAVGAVSWNIYFKEYIHQDTVSIHNFPRKIGPWDSVNLPISEEDYKILETRNAFIRKYTHLDGNEVYLFIVYSQNNRKVSHPPEICYTGSGATILGNDPVGVDVRPQMGKVIDARKVLVERNDIQQLMYYWYKVGNDFTPNYWKQQMLVAVNTILKKPSSSALMRVSSTVDSSIERGEQKAAGDIEMFTQAIMPLLATYLP